MLSACTELRHRVVLSVGKARGTGCRKATMPVQLAVSPMIWRARGHVSVDPHP